MKKLSYVLLVIALMTFLSLVATTDTVRAAEPIKIGAILDFTGPVADLGPKFKAGIELALEEAGYKVAGKDIKLIVEDGATDVTTALDKFKKLVEKDNKVLITSLINGMYETIKYKTYIIYPTTVDAQTYPFGQYAYQKLGYKSVITIGANYAGKIGYANGFAKGFQDAGGTLVQQLWPPLGCADYSPYISTFKKADVVMYALEGPGPVSRFIYQYRQAGLKMPMVTITQDGDYTPEALKELGDIALGIKGESSYSWQIDNPANKKFVKAIKAKTGKLFPSSSEQNAYTLTQVILAGLKATNGDDSFDKLWPAVLKVKMETASGPLFFTPEGVAVTDMYVTKAEKKDGEYVLSAPLYTAKEVRDWRLPK
jgi:branched-chain amino acid transport system substrate-binding protein